MRVKIRWQNKQYYKYLRIAASIQKLNEIIIRVIFLLLH